MGKIADKKAYIKQKLFEGYTRPRIAELMVRDFGITENYASTFVYTHFSGEKYKTPREKRKRPDFSKTNSKKEDTLNDLAAEMGFE